MTLPLIQQQKDQIKAIFELAEGLNRGKYGTLQMTAQAAAIARLSEYLCVRVAGLVEQSTREVFRELARRGPSQQLSNFVVSRTGRDRNVNSEILCQIAGQFDVGWRHQLENFLADKNRGDSLDSVIRNRHKIAHGQSVSIGLVQIKAWYQPIVEIIDFLENMVLT
jgi:hypothetical protein